MEGITGAADGVVAEVIGSETGRVVEQGAVKAQDLGASGGGSRHSVIDGDRGDGWRRDVKGERERRCTFEINFPFLAGGERASKRRARAVQIAYTALAHPVQSSLLHHGRENDRTGCSWWQQHVTEFLYLLLM